LKNSTNRLFELFIKFSKVKGYKNQHIKINSFQRQDYKIGIACGGGRVMRGMKVREYG
jgi:uridylate kinase